MKQIIKALVVLIVALSVSGCQNQPINYSVGKDTVELVGDGKFQVGKFPDFAKLQMFDGKNSFKILDDSVMKYKKIKETLYVIGDAYTIVYGETNTCKQYSASKKRILVDSENGSGIIYLNSYDDFSDAEKKIFANLKQ